MSDQKSHYRVMGLYGENVKRLKVVDITPQEDIVTLAGENGEGKTTVLDCIRMALGGKDYVDEQPIRNGEEEARIILDLGNIIVKRRFTKQGQYISVETPEGAKFPEPQSKLNDLMGAISFDPLQFTRMKPDEQYRTLRGLVNLDVDIEELDRLNTVDFETRTNVNRKVKELQVQIDSIVLPEGLPVEPVDVTALTQELLQHTAAASAVRDLEGGIMRITADIADIEAEIALKQSELKDALLKKSNRQEALVTAKTKLPAEGRIAEIETLVKNATETNANVMKADEKKGHEAQHQIWSKKSDDLTGAIDARKAQKLEAMQGAKMPISGLSFADGIVMYDGGQGPAPFSQASKAQSIRISTAIAMAMNPAVRIILIEDASLLDDASMAVVKDMARKHGFQIWLEQIHSNDPLAIHIVDGSHEGAVKREDKPKKAVKAAKVA